MLGLEIQHTMYSHVRLQTAFSRFVNPRGKRETLPWEMNCKSVHACTQAHLKSHGVAESEKDPQGERSLVGSVAP